MNRYPFLAAMVLTVLAGCNNNEFEEGPAIAAGETPIIVKTGVATKAAIGTGDEVTATFALISSVTAPDAAAWNSFVPRKTNVFTDANIFADYAADAANVSTGIFTANATTAQAISFNPVRPFIRFLPQESCHYNSAEPSSPSSHSVTVAVATMVGVPVAEAGCLIVRLMLWNLPSIVVRGEPDFNGLIAV